jgi:hypothetical protein
MVVPGLYVLNQGNLAFTQKEAIMSKHLSPSILALCAICAVPAAAQTVQGGNLYIQDFDAPVQITYLTSKATHTTTLYIGMLDVSGSLIGSFEPLIRSVGTPNNTAFIGPCNSCMMNASSNTYTFVPAEGAVELVFLWNNETVNNSYYSSVYSGKSNPVDSTGNKWDKMTYHANNTATIGFEDGGGGVPGDGKLTDWSWDDVNISLTNVGATRPTPAIPEPESWAMMLAGLGMVVGAVRHRRDRAR